MTDLKHLLAQIDRLDQEAEAEPWGHERAVNTENGWSLGTVRSDRTGESVAPEVYDPDGAFIALARTALPQLAKALQAVMEIHKPFHADHYYNGMDGESLHRFVLRCDGCEESGGIEGYPCPTVRAVTDALGGDHD